MNAKYKFIEILEEKNSNISKIRVEEENGVIRTLTVPDELVDGENNVCYRVIAEFAYQEGYTSILEFINKSGKIIKKNDVFNPDVIIESDEDILKSIKNLKVNRNIAICLLATMALAPIAIKGIITGDFSVGTKEMQGMFSGFFVGALASVARISKWQIKEEKEKLMKLK